MRTVPHKKFRIAGTLVDMSMAPVTPTASAGTTTATAATIRDMAGTHPNLVSVAVELLMF